MYWKLDQLDKVHVLHTRAKQSEVGYTRYSKRGIYFSVSFLICVLNLACLCLYRKAYKSRVKQRVYGQKSLPQDSTDSGILPITSSAIVTKDTITSVFHMNTPCTSDLIKFQIVILLKYIFALGKLF